MFVPELIDLEPAKIYDLLDAYTAKYLKMLSVGITSSKDFSETKEKIEFLQTKIRKLHAAVKEKSGELPKGIMIAIR